MLRFYARLGCCFLAMASATFAKNEPAVNVRMLSPNAQIFLDDELVAKSRNLKREIPGFDRDTSKMKRRDPLRLTATWGDNNQKLPENQPLALRFLLRSGSLFAFQIQP